MYADRDARLEDGPAAGAEDVLANIAAAEALLLADAGLPGADGAMPLETDALQQLESQVQPSATRDDDPETLRPDVQSSMVKAPESTQVASLVMGPWWKVGLGGTALAAAAAGLGGGGGDTDDGALGQGNTGGGLDLPPPPAPASGDISAAPPPSGIIFGEEDAGGGMRPGRGTTPAPAPDTTAPEAASMLLLQAGDGGGLILTGRAEANSTVTITLPSPTWTTLTATAAADGTFSVAITETVRPGDVLRVTVKDAAGNLSDLAQVENPDLSFERISTLADGRVMVTGTAPVQTHFVQIDWPDGSITEQAIGDNDTFRAVSQKVPGNGLIYAVALDGNAQELDTSTQSYKGEALIDLTTGTVAPTDALAWDAAPAASEGVGVITLSALAADAQGMARDPLSGRGMFAPVASVMRLDEDHVLQGHIG